MKKILKTSSRRGFSIFEGCAVLLLGGFLLVAGGRLYQNLSPRLLIISARHQLIADLKEVHQNAVGHKKDVVLSFEPIKQTYSIDGKSHHLSVPFGIVMDNETPSIATDAFTFNFHSDGTATGGTISLYKNDYQENIHIDSKTGASEIANP